MRQLGGIADQMIKIQVDHRYHPAHQRFSKLTRHYPNAEELRRLKG